MINDEGLIDRDLVGVDADFGTDVARVGRGEDKPFVVKREAWLRGSVWVSVRAEGGHCTKPRFLDEDDIEIVVVCL